MLKQKIQDTKFSHVQNTIKKYVLTHEHDIQNLSLKDLANQTYTSSATVLRFISKLGYNNYVEFQKDFSREIEYLDAHFQNIDPNYPFLETDSIYTISSKITILAKETMDDTLHLMTHDSLQMAVNLISRAKHIHLFAISYSLLHGQEFRFNMMRIGKMVHICEQIGEEYFTLNLLTKDDCAIFISYSGEREKLVDIAKRCRLKSVPIIVITNVGDSRLKKYADVVLHISTREKLYSKIAGFCNEYSIKLILDILYSCYFASDYQKHLNMKLQVSEYAEEGKQYITSDILKEPVNYFV